MEALPTLPQEAWDLVLLNYKNDQTVPDLWLSLRHVNRKFKNSIESLFIKSLLPETWFRFQLGEHWDEDIGRVILDSKFQFSHLSDGETKAIFAIEDAATKYHAMIRERMRLNIEEKSIEAPQHTIQIKYDVTDGPIPALSLDYENLTLSCDWRDLFTIFYAEVQMSSKTNHDWVKSQESRMAGLKAQMESEQLDMMSTIMQAMSEFALSNDNGLKLARRARIRRQFKDIGVEWDAEANGYAAEEKVLLKRLADIRQLVGFEEISDAGSDEDEDEEEEDEWEDDDDDDDARSDDDPNSVD